VATKQDLFLSLLLSLGQIALADGLPGGIDCLQIALRAWKKTSVVMIVYKLRQGSYNGRW
jgi:hypothetical protein